MSLIKIKIRKKPKKGKSPKRKGRKVDKFIAMTYKMWTPITDIKRTFFVWKGQFAHSVKEKEIRDILKGMNLRFYREVSFDMVKRFDFYIPLIDLVIEYDGGQHFNDLYQIKNDIEKEKILKRNNVKFIRYNKTHNLKEQIAHDLIHHPVLKQNICSPQ